MALLFVAAGGVGPGPPGGLHLAGRRSTDDDEGQHVDGVDGKLGERDGRYALALAAEIAGQDDGRVGRAVPEQDRFRLGELGAAALRDGIVEGDDEIALGGGADARFDRLPGGQQIGERDGAEIMAERCTGAGGGGLHGGDAGRHDDLDAAGGVGEGGVVQAFEGERRHGVDAGVAGGDERHGAAFRRQRQRLPDAGFLRAERGIEPFRGP